MRFMSYFRSALNDDRGATAIEYGLIVSLIVIAIIAAMGGVASETSRMWNHVEEKVIEAMP